MPMAVDPNTPPRIVMCAMAPARRALVACAVSWIQGSDGLQPPKGIKKTETILETSHIFRIGWDFSL